MFPGIDGFHWTFGHVIFSSLFFAVVLTIFTTVASAAWCERRAIFADHRAIDFCWQADFAELPRGRSPLPARTWPEESCPEPVTMPSIAGIAASIRSSRVLPATGIRLARGLIIRQIVTITADTPG